MSSILSEGLSDICTNDICANDICAKYAFEGKWLYWQPILT